MNRFGIVRISGFGSRLVADTTIRCQQIRGMVAAPVDNDFSTDFPKRPLTALILYSKDKYPLMRERNPTAKPQEIIKLVSQSWKQEPQNQKQKYLDQAALALSAYRNAMARISPAVKEKMLEAKRQKTYRREMRSRRILEKKHNKPKAPANGYALFFKENFVKPSDRSGFAQACKDVADKWKRVEASVKRVYQEKTAALRADYKKKLAEWKNTMKNSGWEHLTQRLLSPQQKVVHKKRALIERQQQQKKAMRQRVKQRAQRKLATVALQRKRKAMAMKKAAAIKKTKALAKRKDMVKKRAAGRKAKVERKKRIAKVAAKKVKKASTIKKPSPKAKSASAAPKIATMSPKKVSKSAKKLTLMRKITPSKVPAKTSK